MSKIPTTRKASTAKTTYNALENDVYLARIVRFIGLGVQDQPEWNGEKKDPAFKSSFQFELLGVDATGVDSEGKAIDPRPACQFGDFYLFPGAKRGKVFDLCKVLDPALEKVPGDLSWFTNKLGAVLNVEVGSYTDKNGNVRNKIVGLSPASRRDRDNAEDARSEMVGFDPYTDSPEMMDAYSKLFKFQRDMLAEAHDSANIVYAGKEPAKQEGMVSKPKAPAAQGTTAPAQGGVAYDDDIPF